MRRRTPVDAQTYLGGLSVYARNLIIAVPLLLFGIIQLLLTYAAGPIFAPVGGIGMGSIVGLISNLLLGFAFGVSLLAADDAWRHGRTRLASSWAEAKRKAGNILITTLGFFFILWIAQMIGGFIGTAGAMLFSAVVLFFLIYSLPAAALGGVPAQESFSASIRIARAYPLATGVLVVVSLLVGYYLGTIVPALLGAYVSVGAFMVLQLVLSAVMMGYVATILAKQYADFAFRSF